MPQRLPAVALPSPILTRFDGGATNGNRPDERVLISQFALIF